VKTPGKRDLRQRLTSLVSAAIFLGFLWVLFKKMIIVTWIVMPWWGLILLLIVLFFFIETMVARTVGAKEPVDRATETAISGMKSASETAATAGQDGLDAVKKRLEAYDKKPK
jgi:ABC-type protease/lipase transport system fused ATPase/permease subunit